MNGKKPKIMRAIEENIRAIYWCPQCEIHRVFNPAEARDHVRTHRGHDEDPKHRENLMCIVCKLRSYFTPFEFASHRIGHEECEGLPSIFTSRELPEDPSERTTTMEPEPQPQLPYVRVPNEEEET